MKRPRVLMIGPFPRDPCRINGGVAAAMMYLSTALAASNEVDLYGARILEGEEENDQIAGFDWPLFDIALGHGSLTTLYRRQQRRLDDLIHKLRPDILHAQGADISGYLAVRSGIPTVVTVHGLLMACARLNTDVIEKARSMLAAAFTERTTVRRASDLIVISPFVRQFYGADAAGRCHDIPNAVSRAYFDVSRRPEQRRFLYAGRISRGKGLTDLLEAVLSAQSSGLRVILAGAASDRKYEAELKARVQASGLEGTIEFVGLLDESALLQEFERATALVLPSYQETAPMVVQQAMAAGLPVIASRVGGIPFQVDDGVTGFLFEPGDIRTFAGMLLRMIGDPELGQSTGAAARSIARERYGADTVASATTKVYRGMIDRMGAHAVA